jgi:predicted PurR-regulated permease PerM
MIWQLAALVAGGLMAGFLGALAVSVLVMVFIIWRDRVKGD